MDTVILEKQITLSVEKESIILLHLIHLLLVQKKIVHDTKKLDNMVEIISILRY